MRKSKNKRTTRNQFRGYEKQRTRLLKDANTILTLAKDSARNLTDEEQTQVTKLQEDAAALDKKIKRHNVRTRGERFNPVKRRKVTTDPVRNLPAGGGAAPFVTTGAVYRDSERYSFSRAIQLANGFIGPEKAKTEVHIGNSLRALYQGYGFGGSGERSILVPFATEHIPAMEPAGEKLRDEIRQRIRVGGNQFDPDEVKHIQRRINAGQGRAAGSPALGTISDLLGATLVGPAVLGELIDLQRNREVFASAGSTEVAMPPTGRALYPKLTGGATAYWVGEANPVTNTAEATGFLDLRAKKLAILVYLNNELLRFGSISAEAMVRVDMAKVGALAADLAMLEGTGGNRIKGLLTYATTGADPLNTYTAAKTGTDGNTFNPADIYGMEAKLPDAIDGPTAYVMRKSLFAGLISRRADAITAGDAAGPFLLNITRTNDMPVQYAMNGVPVVRSSQVSATRVKGAGTTLTYALAGYFPDWIVARMGIMEILLNNMGDTVFQNDQTAIRGIQHIDAGARHAKSFVLCDQLVNS